MRAAWTVLEQEIRDRRMTLEEFAEYAEVFAREHKEVGTLSLRHLKRLVAGRGPNDQPLGPVRPATARLLESIFGLSIAKLLATPDANMGSDDEQPESGVLAWLDKNADWISNASRQTVASQFARVSVRESDSRDRRRATVSRGQIAQALSDYYPPRLPDYGIYRAVCEGRELVTSVVARRSWLDLGSPLTPEVDRMTLASVKVEGNAAQRDITDPYAFNRLAEAATLDVRLANEPIYRLLSVEVEAGSISGTFGMVPFADYALTMDLLEGELIDAIVSNATIRRGKLALRDKYLPDLASVVDTAGRLCAGGALALCAIARPFDPYRGGPDYALLVQERSGQVLNAAGRLSVIPKGFHQPLKDVRTEARIGDTLRREMEEELFGRAEVDSTLGQRRAAAPMHPGRLSEPMRWLTDDPARLRLECTGFGLNLVSGNFEFASLIVIDDEEFWARFGGQVEANWETAGLRVYSSLDRELVAELIADESWSNEGLFAFLLGIRRLADIGGDRVDLPTVEHLDITQSR